MGNDLCSYSGSNHKDAWFFNYDHRIGTALCPGCGQRVPVDALMDKDRVEGVHWRPHPAADPEGPPDST
jgi:hypothetical protein